MYTTRTRIWVVLHSTYIIFFLPKCVTYRNWCERHVYKQPIIFIIIQIGAKIIPLRLIACMYRWNVVLVYE